MKQATEDPFQKIVGVPLIISRFIVWVFSFLFSKKMDVRAPGTGEESAQTRWNRFR